MAGKQMNASRIRQALTDIETNEAALGWLRQYGGGIHARGDSADVKVHLNHASGCPGAKEAASVMSSFAKFSLPDLVQTAIRNCENTIEIAREAIWQEVSNGR